MVVQKALDDLKERPHDEKTTVASSIAIAVVIILLIGWAFIFLRNIRKTPPTLEGGVVPQSQFDYSIFKNSQQEIQNEYQNAANQLRQMRQN